MYGCRKLMEKYHDYSTRLRSNTLTSLTTRLRLAHCYSTIEQFF
jgi:hypothetical protein